MFLLLGLVWLGARFSGPVVALAASWLFSSLPIALGFIEYRGFNKDDETYVFVMVAYVSAFVVGALFSMASRVRKMPRSSLNSLYVDAPQRKLARGALILSFIAVTAQLVDFSLLGGASLDDLAGLRDIFQAKISTPFTLIANVTTWSCLYCFAFAYLGKSSLRRGEYWLYLLPSGGYFLMALLSAGRQTAFQLMLFAIMLAYVPGMKSSARRKGKSNFWTASAVVVTMCAYMGWVAVKRNDGSISEDKVLALSHMFNFALGATFEAFASWWNADVRTSAVEAMVYFSGSVALFADFIRAPGVDTFYSLGAMSFPFLARQVEPLTGVSVLSLLQRKVELLYGLGLMGNGWTTGFSSFILDFGYVGGGLFQFVFGYYAQATWETAKASRMIQDKIIASLMLVAAAYTPFLVASAETNLLLLWGACILMRMHLQRRHGFAIRQTNKGM